MMGVRGVPIFMIFWGGGRRGGICFMSLDEFWMNMNVDAKILHIRLID